MFRQQLSSSPILVLVVLLGVIGVPFFFFGFVAIRDFFETPLTSIVILLSIAAMTFFILRALARTHTAEIDSEAFILRSISPFSSKTATIKFTEIKEIKYGFFSPVFPTAVLVLARPSELGVRVRFITEAEDRNNQGQVVENLNEVIARAKGLIK